MRGELLLLLGLWSCGGALSAVADAGTPDATDATDDGPPHDVVAFPDAGAIVDAAAAPCPIAPPTAGEPCHTWLICEYGSEPSPTCNQLFECYAAQCSTAAPTWHSVGPRSTCPIPPPTGCPSTFAEATDSDAASCTAGMPCDYAAGICQCNGHAWGCLDAPASCPKQRPRLGTPCSVQMGPMEWCPFEFDTFGVYPGCAAHGYLCSDGVWWVSEGCGLGPPPPC